MVGGVAGRMEDFERPVRALDLVAVSDAHVGRKRMIDELFAGRHVSGLCPRPLTATAESEDRGTGGSRQSGCAVAMVAVGVGDDNVGDRASSGGGENGGAMGFVLRPRINDGEPCRADEIGIGAAKCERAGIGCHDAHDTWRHGLGMAVAERHRRFEGDLGQGRPRSRRGTHSGMNGPCGPTACNSAGGSARKNGRQRGMVGARGFEPPTPCSRSKCATRLRYAPTGAASIERRSQRGAAGRGERACPRWPQCGAKVRAGALYSHPAPWPQALPRGAFSSGMMCRAERGRCWRTAPPVWCAPRGVRTAGFGA